MYRCKAFIIFFLTSFVFAENNITIDEVNLNYKILAALNYAEKEPNKAIELYKEIYNTTNSAVYLKEAIILAQMISDKESLKTLIPLGKESLKNDVGYLKIAISNALTDKNAKEVNSLANQLVEIEKSGKNYSILAFSEDMLMLNSKSVESYKKAYELEPNEEYLLRMADLLINKFHKKDEAIRYLETHRMMRGCENFVCEVLADIYRFDKNYKELAKIYEAQYLASLNTMYLDDAIGVLFHLKEEEKIIKLLENYSYQPKLLMDLYAKNGKINLSKEIADREFNRTKDMEFLALNAIYEYEIFRDKNITKEDLTGVIEKFESAMASLKDPIYLNYYGYLLIEHDIDVKKGMKFVEKALKIESNSAYYLDSLAWGEYKLGRCREAENIMKKIKKEELGKSGELKEHLEAIQKCLKKDKK